MLFYIFLFHKILKCQKKSRERERERERKRSVSGWNCGFKWIWSKHLNNAIKSKWESIRFYHVALCMSSISFSLSPHPIFLTTTGLSHKCRRLRDLDPPPFPSSWTLPLLISLISKMKGFLHSILVFHVIKPVILYIPVSQNIEMPKEK